ncbi:tRNA pseudouridine(38-40) synthase TruA [Agromyces cerinus]|uniref:tRNA pseudouridine synthase A n=1 Tax=Agromyces cerinus subsp. cerinus TaxID=232089 RepID=A0A1N6FF36_9MICO|nr:tRNA pseudouridine(38-40) synthase TruA [Agromyces cerinus]SIN93901.1 tRNA pseudouridine38-40 synthase [Agromyces cerinus subsp. cerinus]
MVVSESVASPGTGGYPAVPAGADDGWVRVRLSIAYDGTRFNGWSRQPGLRTVQGVVEDALGLLFRRTGAVPRLTVAGRTDAGVHALGQVAHFDVPTSALAAVTRARRGDATGRGAADPAAVLLRRLTGVIGASDADVVVTAAAPAPDGFDARFSAMWRRYEYRIADSAAVRDPLDRLRTVWHSRALDTERMDVAAQTLLGLHDFAAFCKPRAEATTIRTLQSYRWRRDSGGVLVASLQADAFCHSMVRALIGAAVAVGEGRLDVEAPAALLQAGQRTNAFMVMPAKGLVLTEVGYPDDHELATRAALTRARRELRVQIEGGLADESEAGE